MVGESSKKKNALPKTPFHLTWVRIAARLLLGEKVEDIARMEDTTKYFVQVALKEVGPFFSKFRGTTYNPDKVCEPIGVLEDDVAPDEPIDARILHQVEQRAASGDLEAIKLWMDAKKKGLIQTAESPHRYIPPATLSQKQRDIVNCRKDCLAVGERQVGKTKSVFHRVIQEMLEKPFIKWYFIAQQSKSAKSLLAKMISEEWESIKDIVAEYTAMRLTLYNGATLEILATTPTDIKGKTGSFWIDEFDQVFLLEGDIGKDVIAHVIPIIRSRPDFHMIFSANIPMDTTDSVLFAYIRQAAVSSDLFMEEFILRMEDVPILQARVDADPAKEKYLHKFISAIKGPEAADAQLHGIAPTGTAIFQDKYLQDALTSWEPFIKSLRPFIHPRTVIAVDPGYAHATGVVVLREFEGHIWEPASKFDWMRGADLKGNVIQTGSIEFHGGELTQQQILFKIKSLANEFRDVEPVMVWMETQVVGKFWTDDLAEMGLNIRGGTFGRDGFVKSRLGKAETARVLFERGALHLCNGNLVKELATWRPAPDKSDDRQKGDMADAFMHAVAFLVDEADTRMGLARGNRSRRSGGLACTGSTSVRNPFFKSG
jgi:hypothetical protein